jgi:hypothetical protein
VDVKVDGAWHGIVLQKSELNTTSGPWFPLL